MVVGVEKVGGCVVVVLGVVVDMKLGDVMKVENVIFGILFCGSGGVGVIIV